MATFFNPFVSNISFDSMILNKVADRSDPAVNDLLLFMEAAEISFPILTLSVVKEINHPKTPLAVRRAVVDFSYSIETTVTDEELRQKEKLVTSASGAAKEENIAPDLLHVAEAAKYGCKFFVTYDEPLLKRRRLIRDVLQIDILRPADLLSHIGEARRRGYHPR